MQTIDVPQSASMYRYLEKRDFDSAYKVACLGVTEADWKQLALEALQVRRRGRGGGWTWQGGRDEVAGGVHGEGEG